MDSTGPDVYLTWPKAFAPIPASLPPTLPAPVTEGSFRAPFGIDTDLYNFVLRPEIPLVFATAYVVTVFALNAYNRNRDHKAWWLSKQTWFQYFVVVHNVVLAIYSFATFVAMFRAITETLPSWNDNAGENWRAKTADALCKMHGPRGFGDATTFNTTINIWEAKNSMIHLAPNGTPDPTDVGRLWNEGLAFWGWFFYVSKFYEVIDTLIILAKGKRSATLQTYHHAGAMLCMWAGIRYMSPPIWMFVFINSAIHAMMYTYFTLSSLGVKVPTAIKRTLTSLQIAQFVFGASYAALHLFIQYDIPVSVPFQVVHNVERAFSTAVPSASSALHGAASSVSSFVESPTISASVGALIKKLLLRAAGEEGVAERVAMHHHHEQDLFLDSVPKIEEKIERFVERRFETKYRTESTRINCIDTSGEAFAIYLNLLYLAPLTILFARFFVRAYTQRGKPRSAGQVAQSAAESVRDAKRETEASFDRAGEKAEDELQKAGPEAQEKAKQLQDEVKKDLQDIKEGVRNRRVSEKIGAAVNDYEGKVKELGEKAKEMVNGSGSGGKSSSRRSSPSKKPQDESAVEDEPEVKQEDTGSAPAPAADAGNDDDHEDSAKPEEPKTAGPEEEKQDPAPENSPKPEDTDAMGQSGVNIDPDPPAGEGGESLKPDAAGADSSKDVNIDLDPPAGEGGESLKPDAAGADSSKHADEDTEPSKGEDGT